MLFIVCGLCLNGTTTLHLKPGIPGQEKQTHILPGVATEPTSCALVYDVMSSNPQKLTVTILYTLERIVIDMKNPFFLFQSVHLAHRSLAPGSVFINKGESLDTSVNRSPAAYLNNPKEERAR